MHCSSPSELGQSVQFPVNPPDEVRLTQRAGLPTCRPNARCSSVKSARKERENPRQKYQRLRHSSGHLPRARCTQRTAARERATPAARCRRARSTASAGSAATFSSSLPRCWCSRGCSSPRMSGKALLSAPTCRLLAVCFRVDGRYRWQARLGLLSLAWT